MGQELPSSIVYLGPKKNKFVQLKNPLSGYLYFKKYRLNLLTGEKELQSIEEFLSLLNQIHIKGH